MMISVCFATTVSCQYANLEFVENKGQWEPQIKYKGVMNNGAFFLTDNGFTVVLNDNDDLAGMADFFHGHFHDSVGVQPKSKHSVSENQSVTVRSHAYNVKFLNADFSEIVPDKPIESYNNYFQGNDANKWKGNCKIFQAVTYRNIYPGIDVRYYTNEGKLKYDIIVHPGADASRLIMQYEGVDKLLLKEGQLVVKTSVGDVKELIPYSYQVINGQKKEVNSSFRVAGNLVKFNLENYSKANTLIIDPTLIFSTFTGSSSDNWGYTATYGPDGSFYAGGIVFGAGFPTSSGAFQTTYNGGIDEGERGGFDIGIMKFTPNGSNRIYATYIGGSVNEHPHSMVVDPAGNLIIAGRTSSPNYPTTLPTIGPGGGYDIILTKLNATGTALIGSRKIGGSRTDGINIRSKYSTPFGVETLRRNYGDDSRSEVVIDESGDILLASNTQSSDFPTTSGAFQTALKGRQDAVFIKASPDLSNVLFSSLLGGDGDDAAFVLATNPSNGNIYLGGNTTSNNLPGDKTGVIHSTFQGGQTDGFVSIITSSGTLLKTSYWGTAGNDMIYGIQFDKFAFPYIMGTTSVTWPVVNAPFSQTGGKQFISKLKPDLSDYVYSTNFGTNAANPNISPIAFLVDRCENVYVSGWGGNVNSGSPGYPNSGTLGLSVTPDAEQNSTDNSDFYFFVLEKNATRQLYGSFFGQNGGTGEHVDGGTSRFDRNGVIYQAMCANCGRDVAFPTTPGVWSPTNGSSNCNLAAVKIAFNLSGVAGSVKSSIAGSTNDTVGCVPLTVTFRDTIAVGKKYVWIFGDGSRDTTSIPTSSHTYKAIGSYPVMLISIDSSKCNIADTARTNISVKTFKAYLNFNYKKLAPCDSFNYEFYNTSFALPAVRPFSATSFVWDFDDNSTPLVAGLNTVRHSFPGPGTYNIKLLLQDTNFCNAPADTTKQLRISTNVKAIFTTPLKGCAPYNALFSNVSDGGSIFFWSFGDGGTSNQSSPTHLYVAPGTYTVKLTVIDSGTCNIIDSTSSIVTVEDKPTASFFYVPNPPQENTPIIFTNTSINATRYLWDFGDGETLNTVNRDDVSHTYNVTDTFQAMLVAFNNSGCSDTARTFIAAKALPLLDVPNAFTPNGDGVNDRVFVRGYGIAKMTWRIYNRWGTIVFETTDRKQGWDGTYKGQVQPLEVYHYTLDVEFFDKKRYQKTGDITLLK